MVKQAFLISPCSNPSEKRPALQIGINRPVLLFINRVIPNTKPVFQLSKNKQSKMPQSGRLPVSGEITNMPESGSDYHLGPFFGSMEGSLQLWSSHLLYLITPQKPEKNRRGLYPKSGHNSAPISGNRSIWAPFRYRQPPL